MARIRRSIQELEQRYLDGTDRASLEKVIRAFAALQEKPANDPDSFFTIGGIHGAPLQKDTEEKIPEIEWWGGYCSHRTVLFPTWHRAYVLRMENALRRVPGCADVTVPYWDECADMKNPVPEILTTPTFRLDNRNIRNPLYSNKLVAAIKDEFSTDPKTRELDKRYEKPKGYETVRFPLSGLVGSEAYRKDSEIWNKNFADQKKRTQYLNGNVSNWLLTGLNTGKTDTPVPDKLASTSTFERYKACLQTKEYTTFSNLATQSEKQKQGAKSADDRQQLHDISIESPHNSIHLAVGGFYQPGEYLANPEGFWKDGRGSNGDMAANEMAGHDPIFYLHHAYIDYVFWLWQKKHKRTARGSITIENPKSDGANSGYKSQPGFPAFTQLTMKTPLRPFRKPGRSGNADSDFYNSEDLTDIVNDLGYDYSKGSLSNFAEEDFAPRDDVEFASVQKSPDINLAEYPGSFVIRTYATTSSGTEYEVGREAILGRWSIDACTNCQSHDTFTAITPIQKDLADFLLEKEGEDIKYVVKIQHGDNSELPGSFSAREMETENILVQ